MCRMSKKFIKAIPLAKDPGRNQLHTNTTMNHESKEKRINALFKYMRKEGRQNYDGEVISQTEHCLQSAKLAVDANADEETILGALLHDIGRILPRDPSKIPKELATREGFSGRMPHDKYGEAYLRQFGFSEKVCQVVGGHVMAKRYITGLDPTYYDTLSPASKTSLKYQGGPMSKEEIANSQNDPWLAEKLQVRGFDDLAKRSDYTAPGLEHYFDMAVRNLAGSKKSPIS